MRGTGQVRKLAAVVAVVLGLATEVLALPAPTELLTDLGINPWRDLDNQVPTSPGVCYATEDRVRSRESTKAQLPLSSRALSSRNRTVPSAASRYRRRVSSSTSPREAS